MEKSLKVLAVSLAGIFAILFIMTTPLTFVLYNVEQSVFDADLYKQALVEERVYERLPEMTARTLAVAAQRPEGNVVLSIFRNISEEEWRGFVFGLFPPNVLKVLAEDAITQVMTYLNGESNEAVLSLTSLKTHLGSLEGINAIYGILKSQPDCSVEQLTAIAMGQEDIVLCNPPETFLFLDLRPIYEAEIRATVTLIPEQVTLIAASPQRAQKLQDLKNLRTIVRLSPLLPILCLLAVTVLVVRSLKDWLNWWGYPLLFAGLISMLMSALSRPLASLMFQGFVAPILPDALPSDFVDVFKDLFASVVHNAVQPILLAAGIMSLVGLIMVAITFLFRERLRKPPVYKRSV
jgi:hypothetical protein